MAGGEAGEREREARRGGRGQQEGGAASCEERGGRSRGEGGVSKKIVSNLSAVFLLRSAGGADLLLL
jgi:hypothetical protein